MAFTGPGRTRDTTDKMNALGFHGKDMDHLPNRTILSLFQPEPSSQMPELEVDTTILSQWNVTPDFNSPKIKSLVPKKLLKLMSLRC
jgi:hypothetical protein